MDYCGKEYHYSLDHDYKTWFFSQHFWPEHDFSGCAGHEPELRQLRDASRALVGKPIISWLEGFPLSLRLSTAGPGVDRNGEYTDGDVLMFKCCNTLSRATSFGLHHLLYHLLRDAAVLEVRLLGVQEVSSEWNQRASRFGLEFGDLSTLKLAITAVGEVLGEGSRRLRCKRLVCNFVPTPESMAEVCRYFLFRTLYVNLPDEGTPLEGMLEALATVRRDKTCRHLSRVKSNNEYYFYPHSRLLPLDQIDRVLRFLQHREGLVMAHCVPDVVFLTYESEQEGYWPSEICPRGAGSEVEKNRLEYRLRKWTVAVNFVCSSR